MQRSRSCITFPSPQTDALRERGEERRERKKREKEYDMWVHL
jgi:hypothetical protein